MFVYYLYLFSRTLFCAALFVSFIWSPDVGFYTLEHSLKSDPEGPFSFFIIFYASLLALLFAILKKKKIAMYVAFIPEMLIAFAIVFGLLLSLVQWMV